MKKLLTLLFLSLPCAVVAEEGAFYVYDDSASRLNHYIPSGWMGSFKSLKISNSTTGQHSGKTCIKIDYDVTKDPETSWAGIYWQNPVNNWGDKRGGYDLTGYKKLTFWAKGTGEIGEIGMGGITGQLQDGDSDRATLDRIVLTKDWKQYTIDLKGLDLSHIIGGFYFSTSADYNEKNMVLFLDEIKYER